MDIKEITSKVDHTLLSKTATWNDIEKLIDDAVKYQTASVCIPACFVEVARKYIDGKLPFNKQKDQMSICTVIGFPNGYSTSRVKVFETQDAIRNGADEIDMVININYLKQKRYDLIYNEIAAVKHACGDKILKVIIETCLLTNEEIIEMCEIVTNAGADYIKTSTGFDKEGANFQVVKLMKNNVGTNIKVKAAGGISSIEDAEKYITLGADRLGTSRIIKILEESDNA